MGLDYNYKEDVWGKVHFSTNGESHMEFTLKIHHQKTMDNSLAERYLHNTAVKITNHSSHFSSNDIGTWTAGVPPAFNFKSAEMQETVALYKAKKVYKVVSVIQPPFMQWNETKSINISH